MSTTTEVAEQYAAVGRRVGGYLIDGALIAVAIGAFGLGPALLTQKYALVALGYLAAVALWIVQWFLLGQRGFTVGKYIAGTRVVDEATGQPLGMGRAFVRLFILGLLAGFGIVALVLLVVVIRDPRRQGWHDKLARSVEVPAPEPSAPHSWTLEPGSAILPSTGTALTGPVPPPPGAPSPVAPAPISDQTVTGATPASAGPAPAVVAPPPGVPKPPTIAAAGMVGPPPGLVSAPGRTPEPPQARETPQAPVVSFPGPAEVAPPRVAAASFPEPGSTLGTAPAAASASPIDERTRLSAGPNPAAAGPRNWVLRPSSGVPFTITGATLVGRDPDAALHPGAVVQAVDDPAFTVSKTHALLSLDGDVLKVQDLDSTHGVVVRRQGDEMQIAPRSSTKVLAGDVLVLGALEIAVHVD